MLRLGLGSALFGIVVALVLTSLHAQNPPSSANTFRESFERPGAVWRAGVADSSYREIAQSVDNKVSHTGQSSVHLRLTANTHAGVERSRRGRFISVSQAALDLRL